MPHDWIVTAAQMVCTPITYSVMVETNSAAVARQFFSALMEKDFHQAVDLICEGALSSMADGWKQRVLYPPSHNQPEDYMRHDPNMPRATAEYLAESATRHEGSERTSRFAELPGIDSEEQLLSATARELAVAYLSGIHSANSGPDWKVEWQVLGAVPDGAAGAYVVFRQAGGRHRDDDGHVRELRATPHLISMRRSERTWCVVDLYALQRGGGAWFIVNNT
jgi:hypothetical protein